jgi:hypothetical protein
MFKVCGIEKEPFMLQINLFSVDVLTQKTKLGNKNLGCLMHSNFWTFGQKSCQCLYTEGFIGSSFPLPALDYLSMVKDIKDNNT